MLKFHMLLYCFPDNNSAVTPLSQGSMDRCETLRDTEAWLNLLLCCDFSRFVVKNCARGILLLVLGVVLCYFFFFFFWMGLPPDHILICTSWRKFACKKRSKDEVSDQVWLLVRGSSNNYISQHDLLSGPYFQCCFIHCNAFQSWSISSFF